MPEENYSFIPSFQLMQTEEILQLAKTFIELGTNKIRLTGGEPLVRKDAAAIIKNLSAYPIRLSLTTNGVRIHEFIDVFLEANIKSINVSLDTLQEDKFQLITRRNNFKRIRDNIDLLLNNNIHVKVNVVVMKGINDSELTDFIAWTKDSPVHVRFIEFMPFSGNRWMSDKVFTWQNMLESIETKYDFIKLKDETHDTTKKYIVSGHAGTFSVISTMTAPFCSSCNRMRLTADGKMKNCLFSKDETDLLTALRNGRNIKELILQNIYGKAAQRGGQFTENFQELQTDEIHNRSMIGIGG